MILLRKAGSSSEKIIAVRCITYPTIKMNRKIAPPIKDATEYNLQLKPYEYYTLDNGVPVYQIDAGAQDVLQLEMVFYAGTFYEQKRGIAAATNYLLKNGTTQRSAFQLNEDFEY